MSKAPAKPADGRALHLVDVENVLALLHGDPVPVDAGMRYRAVAGVRDGDLVTVAADASRAFQVRAAFPGAGLRAGFGADGAELALIGSTDLDWAARRFTTLVIASGDGRFTEVAEAARVRGLRVVVVALRRSLSRSLAATADEIVEVPEVVGATATVPGDELGMAA